ncbi:STAS-like domain-containing protein [Aeromonas caviae]|uniref:STAS-like domain-containing protein n=1 Tax=Aeromonas TaxID=642 RepID=UPI0016043CB3|nr:STAS-like domain-containing protein [Aeromonas caviae]MBS4711899.1 STAS-like domain-containing protein [Aeromonas caviae]MDX7703059.1 STAS-like domain-containing protein [Aeromonas caviae]MDX7796102.1 STAS-like domain-containing protein [Aeromonas caviae]MEB5775921.1 STAS-like domain-containing protein [Aeromonas caviae]MEB6651167.1 STAS-like domain-containing protein [Aeromonas caviae]
MSKIIKVADKFTSPGPRYISLGKYSGEYFRNLIKEDVLSGQSIIIDLDGTQGYGSSFLEESFGGLIRDGVPVSLVKSIQFKSIEEPDLVKEIQEYIDDEIKRQQTDLDA